MVSKRHIQRTSSSGFTLLELLVVLALAGLLMSLVPSLISAAIPGSKLRMESRDLTASLRETRNRAIVTGRKLDVTIELDPPQYTVANKEPHQMASGITVTAGKEQGPQSDFLLPQIEQSHENEFTVQFYPDGSSSGAVITLRNSPLAYTVTVDWLSGSVSMASGFPADAI